MTIDTLGIVLRVTKYGDTSLICKVFTAALGIQSYIIKGVRNSKSASKNPNILFAGSVLDMIVYRYPHKTLNYVKEYHLESSFGKLNDSVIKNCVRMFCVEVLDNILTDDQEHLDIFDFYQSYLSDLQAFTDNQIANAPLYFATQIGNMAGYGIHENYSSVSCWFNVGEGRFSYHTGNTTQVLTKEESMHLFKLLQYKDIHSFMKHSITNSSRRNIMAAYLEFLSFHAPNFKEIKCLAVLNVVLS